jgi:hypothetical protein
MTIGESSILFGIVVLILTTLYKIAKDGDNTAEMMSLFRGLSIETQTLAIKHGGHDDEIKRLKMSRDEHAEELKHMRKTMRDAGLAND